MWAAISATPTQANVRTTTAPGHEVGQFIATGTATDTAPAMTAMPSTAPNKEWRLVGLECLVRGIDGSNWVLMQARLCAQAPATS